MRAAVGPALVPMDSPLARVRGSENIVTLQGRFGGETTFGGRGAGGEPTAVAILSDLLAIARDEVPLTAKEFDVLTVLSAHRDKVVSRAQLMADVWSEGWYGSTKTLDVTIGRLRQKLEKVSCVDRVVTVRGIGFRLESS